MSGDEKYILVYSAGFIRSVRKLKKSKPDVIRELVLHYPKLVRSPELGKPLRNKLRGYWRIHIAGSFVLLYEVHEHEVRLVDFDHHDRIYKKYS